MKGGGSRLQRVRVFASGKYKFVKNLTKSKSKPSAKAKTKTRRTTKTISKQKGGRGGRIIGNVGWKGMLAGTLGLTLVKIVVRKFAPVGEKYIDGLALLGTGIVGKATGIGTAHLLPAGVALTGSSLLEDVVFGGGIGFVSGAQGGYDA